MSKVYHGWRGEGPAPWMNGGQTASTATNITYYIHPVVDDVWFGSNQTATQGNVYVQSPYLWLDDYGVGDGSAWEPAMSAEEELSPKGKVMNIVKDTEAQIDEIIDGNWDVSFIERNIESLKSQAYDQIEAILTGD